MDGFIREVQKGNCIGISIDLDLESPWAKIKA